MDPYNQPTQQPGQPAQGGAPPGQAPGTQQSPPPQPPQGGRQLPPVDEMSVSTPTLRWVSLDSPEQAVPIGPDDYVLESFFDHQRGRWEALVIVQPREEDEADEEGEEEEEEEEEEE